MSAWIEIDDLLKDSGLTAVALFVSAWIEIMLMTIASFEYGVALFVSAWIEIDDLLKDSGLTAVALFVSAWIEIVMEDQLQENGYSRTLCECVD